MMHHNTKFGNKMFVGWTNIDILTFGVTPIFHRTLWLMMLHYRTKFGNKMFCGSEDIIQTNIHWILNHCCDLDLRCSDQIFPQDTPAYDAVLSM